MAANIINERRGWVQSEKIGIQHRQEVSDNCMEILRTMDEFSWQRYEMELVKRGYKVHLQEKDGGGIYGYSIKRGNSIYKSSILGVGRNLTPSKIEATWAKLHPQERKSNKTCSPTNTDSRQDSCYTTFDCFAACYEALRYNDRRVSQIPCGDTRIRRQYHSAGLFFRRGTSVS